MLQLLDSLDAKDAPNKPGVVAMPHGFMEDFAARHEEDGLDAVIAPIGEAATGVGPSTDMASSLLSRLRSILLRFTRQKVRVFHAAETGWPGWLSL